MRRRWLPAATAFTVVAVLSAPAWGDVGEESRALRVTIQQVVADPDGATRMTVQISGLESGEDIDLERLEIVENGEVVDGIRLADLETTGVRAATPALVVALDTSGSTLGVPIDAAKVAATALVQEVAASDGLVAVVGFSESATTIASLSATADAAVLGIDQIAAAGGTALFDGVARATRMLASHDGPREAIVFSDGGDTTSQSSLDDVRALLAETGVRVTSVVLRTDDFAIEPLRAMAEVNEGRLVEVGGATELSEAFAAITEDLTNRVTVVWESDPVERPAETLNIVASYGEAGAVATDGAQVDNPRLALVSPPVAVEAQPPLVGAFASDAGLTIAAVATGVAAFLLLYLILAGAGERRRRQSVDDRLSSYRTGDLDQGRQDRVGLTDRASGLVDSVPRPATFDAAIAANIEKGDWPLRVSEFLMLSLLVGLLGLLIGGVLLSSALLGFVGMAVGVSGPWLYLKVAIKQRQAAFVDQLPAVLQVIAGALRAGHAFSSALEGAADEVDEPARGELRRASVEGRLGRPLDRALEGVADRMGSEDLQWVIGALEVQREVGGNLAEILNNVATTLRARASLTRHVRALTAEGRLSAWFISAMPFVMFAYLFVTNPEYVRPLYASPIGRILLMTGLVLLVLGVLVLRRLVRPKF